LFGGTCELETRLTAGVSQLDSVVFNLELLKFDAGVGEFTVEVMVVVHLTGESPVIVVNEGVMEQSEID